MWLIGDGTAVASCPMRRCGGFLPDAARRWLLALCGRPWLPQRWLLVRCGTAVASCPMLRGGGFVVSSSNVLHTDSEGLRVSKVSEMSSKMWRIEDECS